jgi:hypothetical protein
MRCISRLIAASVVMLSGGVGCAEDDDYFGEGTTEVVEISSQDSTIPNGGATILKVNFSYDQNAVFYDDEEVVLVIKLPRQLSYRDNSAEIDGPGSRDKDEDPLIKRCANGESYLAFTFNENDLDDAQPPLDGAEAQLKLTVDAVATGQYVPVEARADEDTVLYSCAQIFNYDEQDILSVE